MHWIGCRNPDCRLCLARIHEWSCEVTVPPPLLAMSYTLFHARGAGSLVPLIVLQLLKVPHEVVTLEYDEVVARRDSSQLRRLLAANPLAQFPTLITGDGTVMTEMAGILLYLLHRYGKDTPWALDTLTPGQLATFYRTMVFVPGNVYPTITYQEFPQRLIEFPASAPDEQRKEILSWIEKRATQMRVDAYRLLEGILDNFNTHAYGTLGASSSKFVLGTAHATILDVMLAVVVHFGPHPRPQWMRDSCPRLYASARETVKLPEIGHIMRQGGLTDILDA